MTNNPDQFFVNNDNDRELLRETIRKVQESDFDIPFPREGLGLPPVLFGRITTTWASPATTVEVQPVDPDDFTDDTSLDTVTVYVSYFGTPAGYETLLAADEIVLYMPFQGEDKDSREGVLISAFDGGTTASGTLGRLVDADTSVVDEVTLSKSELTYDITTGLVKGWTDTAQASIILEAIKWLGIEKGGIWYHKPSPVDSVSHPDHWFSVTWTMGTGSITYTLLNGAPVVLTAITIYVDRTGHIWQVETDTQPTPPTNYRYEHCTDPETYPDIIFTSSQGTTVIEADGQCYQYVGTTEDTATSPVPTVGSSYATCEACESAGSNEQWQDCDSSTNQAVLSAAHTDVDYAWLCISSLWKKCFNSGTTFSSPTDPTVLKQCDATPTSCNDLVGWPADDDFGGTGCNSGTTSDDNWGVRWNPTTLYTADITYAIVSSKLDITIPAATPFKGTKFVNRAITPAADWNAKVTVTSTPDNVGNFHGPDCLLRLNTGDSVGHLVRDTNDGGDNWVTIVSGSIVNRVSGNGTKTIEIDYVHSTTTLSFIIDGTTYATKSATPTSVEIYATNEVGANGGSATGGNYTADNFLLKEGASEILIDPTGFACT